MDLQSVDFTIYIYVLPLQLKLSYCEQMLFGYVWAKKEKNCYQKPDRDALWGYLRGSCCCPILSLCHDNTTASVVFVL